MDVFIRSTADALVISEPACRQLTVGMLALIRSLTTGAESAAIQALFKRVGPPAEPGSKPLTATGAAMGSMLQQAGTRLAYTTGPISARIAALFEQAGVSNAKAASYRVLFLRFLEDEIGKDVVANILAQVPELQDPPGG